ncbi:MAG TPA: Mur ligase family protein, partial [Gammaproteobacteria bacterium]|nr:Mur ligase family protein [Gammaproteobacteria bacterium]
LMEDVPLTPFEVGTIAALLIFAEYRLDVIILEVGLGGRLDAVNAIDADVAIVTTIAIDHVEWLGSTREAIGREKAGIFRTNLPAICGDFDPPDSILRYASDIDAPLYCQNQQFGFKENKSSWDWWSNETSLKKLPLPKLLLQNVATALMGVQLLQKTLPVPVQAIHNVLKKVALPGRMEIIPGETLKIFDVSHNPAAVALLADYLVKNPVQGKTYAVFSMLADKDIDGTIEGIEKHIDAWYLAPLQVSRGADKETLQEVFLHKNIKDYRIYENIENAYLEAKATAKKDDRIIIFGSFYTVSKCLNLG